MAADVLVVSNRGPVSFTPAGPGFVPRRFAGGFAGGLDAALRGAPGRPAWIAAAVSEADRAAVRAGAVEEVDLGYDLRLLAFDGETYDRYYNQVCNRVLWFTHHRCLDDVGIGGFGGGDVAAWREAYTPVNRAFAEAAAQAAAPGAAVLVQDYHLTLVPRFLAELRSDLAVAHFTHTAFAPLRDLHRLPQPLLVELVEGMLGARLVAFHARRWTSSFLECAASLGLEVDLERRRVLHRGRVTHVREYPSAIDVAELRRRAGAPDARRWLGRLAGRRWRLVVRADRIEPAKNVARGFDAFRRLLERRPDLRGRVLFVASIYPSREWMPEYRAYAASVREACRRLEEAFPGSLELYTKDDYARSLALLRLYDVLLVNSTMDGLNVVPKEGAALNERSGAIVLSTTTGVYEELRDAVVPIEDAFDVDGTADALEQALLLPEEERRRRAEQARRVAERRAPAAWLEDQVRALRIDSKP